MTKEDATIGNTSGTFRGFQHLDANYIYCPNQFFDVCLSNCSRGTVRFVAYLLRRTLGWRDENGSPIEEKFSIPDQDFITQAGVSKGAIRSVSDEVISRGFVCRTEAGRAKSKGSAGQSAEYTLRWDGRGEYVTDLNSFQGFYAGGGNCSPIPNAFFDQVVPYQRLAVTKVVGTVLRYTVGFESKYGGRRRQASLSLTAIQRYANIKDRTTASSAAEQSRNENFIRRVHEGCFDSRRRVQRAAVYAPRWLDETTTEIIGTKTRPVSNRFKNPTSVGTETRPVERFKNQTSRKTAKKDTYKQQDAVVDNAEGYELLVKEGIGRNAARTLSASVTFEEIQNQIKWLAFRNPENRPAMLRKAIEEEWCEPDGIVEHKRHEHAREREEQENIERAAREAAIAAQKQKHLERRTRLLACWREQSTQDQQKCRQTAVEQAASDLQRRLIHKSSLDSPTPEILEMMALAIAEPIGESS